MSKKFNFEHFSLLYKKKKKKDSIKTIQSSINTQIKRQRVLFQAIQLSIITQFKCQSGSISSNSV